jgi:hypothetical protein
VPDVPEDPVEARGDPGHAGVIAHPGGVGLSRVGSPDATLPWPSWYAGRAMRDPAQLRAYAGRDWSAALRDKARCWRDFKLEHGPAGGVRVADELLRQVRLARPDWPSERERREDMEMHLRLIEVFRRVASRGR